MAKLTNVNGTQTLEATAELFIVPNALYSISDTSDYDTFAEKKLKLMNSISEASGLEAEDDPLMMQVWIVSEDLHTENLVDHYGYYFDSNGVKQPIGNLPAQLPSQLFAGKKEGDIVTIVYPKGSTWYNEAFDIRLEVTCKQLGYRYERFGSFEQVLKQLLARRFAA